jgi:hypothetical protein
MIRGREKSSKRPPIFRDFVVPMVKGSKFLYNLVSLGQKKKALSTNNHTTEQYQKVLALCKDLFEKKTMDYGTAWRILRLPSITDQIFIKASRIRSIQEKGEQKVADDIQGEFIGIVNYSAIALMQLELGPEAPLSLDTATVMDAYNQQVGKAADLMLHKNHDYGEAWRLMRVSSITDIILMKLLRVRQIEELKGQTRVSEGVAANYQDMINYAIFALILLSEQAEGQG